jgi:hypothetical protein
MAARKNTKTAVIDPNSVAITDFCQSQGINEQIFRLELMQHLDNADSAKVVAFDVAQSVASTITATNKALPQQLENPETLTTEALQPTTETAADEPQKPQNSGMVASGSNALNKPATGSQVPIALSEFISKSQEDIELFDLVQVYRNEQILTNSQARDQELVAQLREQRLENRALVFDSLRDLNSRQPIAPELPELPSALSEEIAALSNELGKKLVA